MTIKHRLYLAALLTPAFWLVFLWIFFLSPSAGLMSFTIILIQSLAMSLACAYSVTLFVVALRRCPDNS
jgi:hypothetical protein